MKGKLLGFAIALLATATIGIVQLQSDAAGHPSGKVGNAPVCDVTAIGKRGDTSVDLANTNSLAFKLSGNTASVKFKVTGPSNCKVRVSANSFWAPAQNGRPYSKQVLYQRNTKVFTRGTHAMSVQTPTQPRNGMCYYQVDLTYGTNNITPVLAYAHGKVRGCKPQPKPNAACKSLNVVTLADTKYRFDAKATTAYGAKVRSYTFNVTKDGKLVHTKTVATSSYNYTQTNPGTYKVQVIVNTTAGEKTNNGCTDTFTIKDQPKTPGIKVTKLVDGVKYKQVNVDVEYSYQLAVTNTGNKDLRNAVVTDTPEKGVTLISAAQGTISNNTWTHTIPTLKVGETMSFTLKAKVPEYLAGRIVNTVCVDTPDVPGTPDDCDTAEVDVPKDEKVIVCDPETGKTIVVEKEDQDKYVPVDSDECKKETPPTPENPKAEQLPTTGPEEALAQLFGAASLASAGAYYLTSRRQ